MMKWIRIWTEETLRGTTFSELDVKERGIWFSLLVMAGASATPGIVELRKEVAYPLEFLAITINCPLEDLKSTLQKLQHYEKVKILEDGRIKIVNWDRYQTRYQKYVKPKQETQSEDEDDVHIYEQKNDFTYMNANSVSHGLKVDKKEIRCRKDGDKIRRRLDKEGDNIIRTSEKSKSQKKYSITFNETTKRLEGITPEDIQHWQETFPDVNIKAEIKKAEAWLDANPQKRKKNYKRFLVNWFSRQQDKTKSKNPLEVNSPFELLDEVSLHNLKVAKYVEQKIIEEGQE